MFLLLLGICFICGQHSSAAPIEHPSVTAQSGDTEGRTYSQLLRGDMSLSVSYSTLVLAVFFLLFKENSPECPSVIFFSHVLSVTLQLCWNLSGFVLAASGEGCGFSCMGGQGCWEGLCKKLSLQVQAFIRKKWLWEGAGLQHLELLRLWSLGWDGGWCATAVVFGAPWLCVQSSPQLALPGFFCNSAIAPPLRSTAYPQKYGFR